MKEGVVHNLQGNVCATEKFWLMSKHFCVTKYHSIGVTCHILTEVDMFKNWNIGVYTGGLLNFAVASGGSHLKNGTEAA